MLCVSVMIMGSMFVSPRRNGTASSCRCFLAMVILSRPRRALPLDRTYDGLVDRFRVQLEAPRCSLLPYGVEDVFLRFGPVVVRIAGAMSHKPVSVFLILSLCLLVSSPVVVLILRRCSALAGVAFLWILPFLVLNCSGGYFHFFVLISCGSTSLMVSDAFVLLLAVVVNRDGSRRAVDELAPDCL